MVAIWIFATNEDRRNTVRKWYCFDLAESNLPSLVIPAVFNSRRAGQAEIQYPSKRLIEAKALDSREKARGNDEQEIAKLLLKKIIDGVPAREYLVLVNGV